MQCHRYLPSFHFKHKVVDLKLLLTKVVGGTFFRTQCKYM